jgi:predicted dehydrogenase
MRLAAVVTRDPERGAQARREHPEARIVPAAEEVWSRAGEYDLVVISTPNRTHAELALAALQAGLPVVVDKPFARTASEARTMIEAARARGLMISPYQNRRWDGELLTAKRLIGEGAFGRVLRFESRLERWRPQPKGGWRELGALDEGGGLLFDLGSHLIDQALHLFGAVTHVYAELERRRAGVASEDDVFVALTHASGVRSHLWASYLAAHHAARLRVLGERGAYVKERPDVQEAALRAGARPTAPDWGEEPQEAWGSWSDGANERRIPTERGAYQQYYAQIATALRKGAPPPVDAHDALVGLTTIEAARRSASERQVIAI